MLERRREWLQSLISAIISGLLKVLVSDVSLTRVLPIPGELATLGWLWTAALVLVGAYLPILTRAKTNDPYGNSTRILWGVICFGGAVVCLAGFFGLEFAWKRLPLEAFDVLYFGVEPALFGAIFGFFAAGLSNIMTDRRGNGGSRKEFNE
jgi:hypothetical protein